MSSELESALLSLYPKFSCLLSVTYCSTRGMFEIGVKVAFLVFQNKLQLNWYFSFLGRGLTNRHVNIPFPAYWPLGDGTF